ncbi:hypothetical protein ANCCAN_18551 [Ancylostoma caninum]|uniref:Uncharacterized protein n=1 Tax=Ancylostoma caninum TaxID=29170 RepID=A0A368FXQ4_ANCCA|nr:hypothetical protein ANCCAN_18551 [Ancylostoma caninum]
MNRSRMERISQYSTLQKTSQSTVRSISNKSVRIVTGIVTVFVCTWYLSVASVLTALSLGLREEDLDYVMTLILPQVGPHVDGIFSKLLRTSCMPCLCSCSEATDLLAHDVWIKCRRNIYFTNYFGKEFFHES